LVFRGKLEPPGRNAGSTCLRDPVTARRARIAKPPEIRNPSVETERAYFSLQ